MRLQLCALRLLGFVPADLMDAPAEALDYLAGQLDVPARAVFDSGCAGRRAATITSPSAVTLAVQRADDAALGWLAAWLAELALEHDRPTRLFALACEQLRKLAG